MFSWAQFDFGFYLSFENFFLEFCVVYPANVFINLTPFGLFIKIIYSTCLPSGHCQRMKENASQYKSHSIKTVCAQLQKQKSNLLLKRPKRILRTAETKTSFAERSLNNI